MWGTPHAFMTAQQLCSPGPACGPVTAPIGAPGFAVPEMDSGSFSGHQGGLTVGWNWQDGMFVFGVEGDASWANLSNTSDCTEAAHFWFGIGYQGNCSGKLRSFQTATGRIGLTTDRVLWYVKAGGAWGQFNHQVVTLTNAGGPGPVANIDDNRSGYTVGVGIEYALWNNVSAKLEYDYMDFGTKNLDFPFGLTMAPGVLHIFADDRERMSVLKGGVNWRFNSQPLH